MKVISGLYKGRNLKGYMIEGTRPTMDRVKESLFASINSYLKDSLVLDLFAGSGNLGIEALSNGAREACFCDKNKICINTIKDNLKMLNIENYKIYNMDFRKLIKTINTKFDIIFIDPPYKTDFVPISVKLIDEYDILNKDGILVLEIDNLDNLVYDKNIYKELKNKKYGDKYIIILRKMI